MRLAAALVVARLVRVQEAVGVTGAAEAEAVEELCSATRGSCIDSDTPCYTNAPLGAGETGGRCTAGMRCCVPPRDDAAPKCAAVGGACQSTASPCGGGFASGYCPDMPKDVMCCLTKQPQPLPDKCDSTESALGPAPLLWLGDSQSQHLTRKKKPVGWTLGPRVAAALRKECVDATAVGHPGWTVRKYLTTGKLDALLADRPYKTLVVELGVNDAVAAHDCRSGCSRFEGELRTFVDQARAAGVENIVWVGPAFVDEKDPRPGKNAVKAIFEPKRKALAAVQSRALAELGVAWLDQGELTEDLYRYDGLHYRSSGYKQWAERLLVPLREQLALD